MDASLGRNDEAQIWQWGCGLEQPMIAPLFSNIWTHLYNLPSSSSWEIHSCIGYYQSYEIFGYYGLYFQFFDPFGIFSGWRDNWEQIYTQKFDFQTSRQKLGKNKKQIPKLFNGKRIRNIAILQYLELMFEQKFTSIWPFS